MANEELTERAKTGDAGIYHATGFRAWKSGGSVEERAVLRLEELENPT